MSVRSSLEREDKKVELAKDGERKAGEEANGEERAEMDVDRNDG